MVNRKLKCLPRLGKVKVRVKRTSPLCGLSLHSRSCGFAAHPVFCISAKYLPIPLLYSLPTLQSPPACFSEHAQCTYSIGRALHSYQLRHFCLCPCPSA